MPVRCSFGECPGDSRPRLSAEPSSAGLLSDGIPQCTPCPLWFSSCGSLLLEQILKRRPRVVRPSADRRRGFLFPGHAHLIRSAIVPQIFLGNPFLHRLHALKPASRIEIHALFARMQLEPAFGTLPARRHSLQYRAALRAPRNRMRPRKIYRPRTERVVSLRRRRSRLLPRRFARLVVAILITMLTIFCCHRPLPKHAARIVSLMPPKRQV